MRPLWIPNLVVSLLLLSLTGCGPIFLRTSRVTPPAKVAIGAHAMVATEGAPPSEIGYEILQSGGNAFDAAIAVSLALAVYRPQSTGIGGGGFALGWASGESAPFFFDMRERAPASAVEDAFTNPSQYRWGGTAVGVPGLIAGLALLYEQHGSKRIAWNDLVAPAVRLARDGFPVYPHLARAIELVLNLEGPEIDPEILELIAPNGRPLQAGDTYRNPALSETLRLLGEAGPRFFYEGALAKKIASGIAAAGGFVTEEDLRTYQVRTASPLHGQFDGYDVYGAPLPSSGGLLNLMMLRMWERAPAPPRAEFLTLEDYLVRARISERAFFVRATRLGDPRFESFRAGRFLSDDFIAHLLEATPPESINRTRSQPTSTTNFCIIDSAGNTIVSTQSINYYFGALQAVPGTGIILNNTMDDFSSGEEQENLFGAVTFRPNRIEPGKTPLSSMAPTIVAKNGRVLLALGSPGGPKIISAVWNVLLNRLYFHAPLASAIAAPRIHHQWRPGELLLEAHAASEIFEGIAEQSGDPVVAVTRGIGNVTAIEADPVSGVLYGATDPRREGIAIGW